MENNMLLSFVSFRLEIDCGRDSGQIRRSFTKWFFKIGNLPWERYF